jgi:hypothetical protein
MKLFLLMLTLAAVSVGAAACGGASKNASSAAKASPGTVSTGVGSASASGAAPGTPHSTPSGPPHKDSNDGDNDVEVPDDNVILYYGHAASAADRRAVTTLVQHYYAAAAAADGTKLCTQIYGLIAEAITEEYAQSPASAGKDCAAIMSKLFGQHHKQMAADSAALKVTRVRVEGQKGYAFVFFGTVPEPYVTVHREGGAWKIETLFEIKLP